MLNWVSCNALKVKALRALFLFISIVMPLRLLCLTLHYVSLQQWCDLLKVKPNQSN